MIDVVRRLARLVLVHELLDHVPARAAIQARSATSLAARGGEGDGPGVVELLEAVAEHGLLLVALEEGPALADHVELVQRPLEQLRPAQDTRQSLEAEQKAGWGRKGGGGGGRTEPIEVWLASMRPETR